ncbi:hypothetical protein [Peteryoungia ipomoeae]|uniref:Uncharacterized protein n=1 Tax=Peteryoungia ipomoeae TaxID=1210932 RepID=A0A4S8PAI1_9HYPH|nr:hypothetical protein [Peteryoungia ipomoeae]THV25084.1 hypothetical protein FAA97_02450 [Peteryoungia ipomoeae]
MFAKRRVITFPNGTAFRTPILLPSFSSKGFPSVQKIFKASEEYISEEILVSAYDIHHGLLQGPFDFASMVVLDSGGYEASKETDMSETYENDHVPGVWSRDLHQAVLSKWDCPSPTLFVTYDHHSERLPVREQMERARQLEVPSSGLKNFLIKPESSSSIRLNIGAVLSNIKYLDGVAVIGVTEKEVGNSLLDRMLNIAKIRRELDRLGYDIPIHVFGSLDTFSTFLFFLAGADVFDGLTWLRYAFLDGDTMYRHNFGGLTLPIKTNSDIVEGCCWSHNYQYMVQMQLDMAKFINDHGFHHLGKHAEHFRAAYETMISELEG